jgi:N-acetylglucosamine malate deacetylase 1
MNNPYLSFISGYQRLLKDAAQLTLGGLAPLPLPTPSASAPRVLIFSPHPDDECIVGALPLRLRLELGCEVINVAVTQGSKKERQAGRLKELQDACRYLGFGLVQTAPSGLEKINPKTRQADSDHWQASVEIIARILEEKQPAIIFLPHAEDWNSTHIGTHFLVLDALKTMPAHFATWMVETEFWGAMATPNLMIESSVEDVANLVAAITFHVEEVRRNPYHLCLPSWMNDNVRRGGEVVGGQGGAAPDYTFATLYRLQRYAGQQLIRPYSGGKSVSASDSVAALFV